MIQPKELRIGDYVTDEFYENFKTIIEVDSITKKGINVFIEDDRNYPEIAQSWIEPEYTFDKLFGIPLTEEILLKFGFYEIYKSEFSIRYGIENFDEIEFKWNKTFGWNFYYKTFCIEGIKFVHKLQNLFFSLCGEELNVK